VFRRVGGRGELNVTVRKNDINVVIIMIMC